MVNVGSITTVECAVVLENRGGGLIKAGNTKKRITTVVHKRPPIPKRKLLPIVFYTYGETYAS